MEGYNNFPSYLIQGDNLVCFECNAKPVLWASVSMGIYLCTKCASDHRGYGVHVSFVRSLTLDKWSEDQSKVMEVSGNNRFKSFLMCYNLPRIMPFKDKYYTKAVQYYRELL